MQPMFSPSFIAARSAVMIEVARSVVDAWVPGEAREIDDDMQELTLSVFLAALLGSEPPAATRQRIQRVLPDVMAGTIRATVLPRWLGAIPTPAQRRYRASLEQLRGAISDLVDEHQRRRDAAAPAHGEPPPTGLLDLLLDARDAETGRPMSRTQLEDEVIDLSREPDQQSAFPRALARSRRMKRAGGSQSGNGRNVAQSLDRGFP
jgi:cytochrome P450